MCNAVESVESRNAFYHHDHGNEKYSSNTMHKGLRSTLFSIYLL